MAFALSPSVVVTEKDLTTVVPNVATSIGGCVGTFEWGPVLERIQISTENELKERFGLPNDVNAEDWWTAANYLAYTNNLLVVRGLDEGTAINAVVGDTDAGAAILVKNRDHYDSITFTDQLWVAKYPGTLGNSLQVFAADQNNYSGWTYESQFEGAPSTSNYVSQRGGSRDEFHVIVIDEDGQWSGTAGTILETFPFVSKAVDAKTVDGASNYFIDVIANQSKYIWAGDPEELVGSGAGKAGLDSTTTFDLIGANQVIDTITITNGGTDYNTPGDGTETFAVVFSGGTPETTAAATAYVQGIGTVTVSAGGTGFPINQTGASGFTVEGTGTGATVTYDTNGSGVITAVTVTNTGDGYTGTPTINTNSLGNDDETLVANIFAVSRIAITNRGSGYDDTPTLDIATNGSGTDATATATRTENGLGGSLTQGLSDAAAIDDSNRQAGWALFQNAEEVDVNILMTGPATTTTSKWVIDNVTDTRKDCVVCVSPLKASVVNNGGDITASVKTDKGNLTASSYGIMDSHWKYQFDRYNGVNRYLPLNGDIAGLLARTDFTNDPWFSPAGLNRGIIKNALKLSWTASAANRDALYLDSINPVVNFPGQGIVLFGDKTLTSVPSSFDRINVRRLFITLEKAISTAAKFQLFEINDEFTRNQFKAMVNPFLREVQGRRGITDFKVVADESNNTGDVIDRNEFVADIFIKPSRSINFIQLNFIATRTDVSFSEIGG